MSITLGANSLNVSFSPFKPELPNAQLGKGWRPRAELWIPGKVLYTGVIVTSGAWLLLGLCHISTYTKKLWGVGAPTALAALSPLPACVASLCLLSLKDMATL